MCPWMDLDAATFSALSRTCSATTSFAPPRHARQKRAQLLRRWHCSRMSLGFQSERSRSVSASPTLVPFVWSIGLSPRAWSSARATPLTDAPDHYRSEEHTSELQSLMRISYAVFCLKKKKRPL